MLHIIAGIDAQTSGVYEYDGNDVRKMSDRGKCELRNKKIGIILQDLDCLAMIRCFEISVCRKSSLELIRKALIKSTGIAAAGWSGRTGTQKGEPFIRRSETAGGNLQSLGYGCRGDRRG